MELQRQLCAESQDLAICRALVLRFKHFEPFNSYEDTTGLSHEAYCAQRSANMRYNVRRRQRALEKTGRLELIPVTSPADLESTLPDYLSVSRASWKSPGSMVGFETLQLMYLCAGKGYLGLGILRLDGRPAAVQFWILSGGTAHCARLAYDEACKKLAVGVVLTNFMIAHVLDHDRVNRLDYGYGRDDYKRGWMKNAREYYGFLRSIARRPLDASLPSGISRADGSRDCSSRG